ncbi:MAG: hypothetical protein ABF651_01690 [Sporolactobacillus sp.]
MSRTRTIIQPDTFNQIISYKSAVPDQNSEARNKIKMGMLNSAIRVIGFDKWTRMSDKVKHSIETMCFLATERGFSWCSGRYLSECNLINAATVRRYLKQLEDAQVISRLWRSSSKHNGRGCSVVFWHNHPYFDKYWSHQFFLDAETLPNAQSESIKNTDSINENESIPVPTIYSPDLKSSNLKDRSQDDYLDYLPDYIPHAFAKLYGCYFSLTDNKVTEFYRMAKMAAWKNCQEDNANLVDIATHGFKQLIGQIKLSHHRIKNPIAYFYKICLSLFHDEYIRNLDAAGFFDHAPKGDIWGYD